MTKRLVFLALLFVFIFTNCSDDKDAPSGQVFSEICEPLVQAGLNITVDGDVTSLIDPNDQQAWTDFSNCMANCTDPTDPDCMMGCMSVLGVIPSGGAFSVTCYITNTTLVPITFTLHVGDWFTPFSDSYQPMLCPVDMTFVIDAGITVTEVIPVYCLNSGLSAPADDSDYTLCELIESNGCLTEIIDILKTKDLSATTYSQTMEIQTNIWNCTEGMPVDLDFLNGLPS